MKGGGRVAPIDVCIFAARGSFMDRVTLEIYYE